MEVALEFLDLQLDMDGSGPMALPCPTSGRIFQAAFSSSSFSD